MRANTATICASTFYATKNLNEWTNERTSSDHKHSLHTHCVNSALILVTIFLSTFACQLILSQWKIIFALKKQIHADCWSCSSFFDNIWLLTEHTCPFERKSSTSCAFVALALINKESFSVAHCDVMQLLNTHLMRLVLNTRDIFVFNYASTISKFFYLETHCDIVFFVSLFLFVSFLSILESGSFSVKFFMIFAHMPNTIKTNRSIEIHWICPINLFYFNAHFKCSVNPLRRERENRRICWCDCNEDKKKLMNGLTPTAIPIRK